MIKIHPIIFIKNKMKVVCKQNDLEKALNIVSKAVKGNSTLPILDNILIKTEGKNLFFFSTNLEIAIECFINADIKNEGSITIPAKLFDSYISLLKEENIELSTINEVDFFIKTKNSETKIKGIKSDDFPIIPKVENEGSFIITAKDLMEGISQTVFAASLNTSRPMLSGIYFNVIKERLKMVATDSYRLAEKEVNITESNTNIEEFIIPFSTMIEVGRIFTKEDKKIEVIISKNQVLFMQDNVKLTSRLIEGRFPEYNQIVPKKHTSHIEINVPEFLLAIKRVSLFAKENSYNIKIEIKKEGKLAIYSNATEIGEGKTEIEGKVTGGDSIIALNAQYLIDFLNNVGDDTVLLHIDTKLTPAVLRPKKRNNYLYLVMPLKID